MRTHWIQLVSVLCLAAGQAGCHAPDNSQIAEEQGEEEVLESEQELIGWTAPNLKWILYSVPGTAKLARRTNPGSSSVDSVSVIKTHAFSTHWKPIGVAGNKLLWQRTDTGEVNLWTIDATTGNMVGQQNIALPGPGWKAASIALTDDGVCPAPGISQRTYVITFEGPSPGLGQNKPQPILKMVSNSGTVLDSSTLPLTMGALTSIRDFRRAASGRWAVVTQTFSGTADVTYFQRHQGSWVRLRTDSYSAANGMTGCTITPAGATVTTCAPSFNDTGAGAGYEIAGFQIVQNITSTLVANGLVWTRTDGTAKVFALEPLGEQNTAPTVLNSGLATYSAKSLAAADDGGEPGAGLLCDHTGWQQASPTNFSEL